MARQMASSPAQGKRAHDEGDDIQCLGLAVVPGVEATQGTAGGTILCGRPSNSAWYGETWVLWGLS